MNTNMIMSKDMADFIIKATKAVDNDAIINIDNQGMRILLVDPANVMMMYLDVPAEDLILLEAPEDTQIGMDMNELSDDISIMNKDDQLKLQYDGEMLYIGAGPAQMSRPPLDTGTMRAIPKVPNLEMKCIANISAKQAAKAISLISKKSDHAELIMDDGALFFNAHNKSNKASIEMTEDVEIVTSPKYASALYSLDYISDIFKVMNKGQMIVEFNTDFPLVTRMKFGTSSELRYLLAPRIERD